MNAPNINDPFFLGPEEDNELTPYTLGPNASPHTLPCPLTLALETLDEELLLLTYRLEILLRKQSLNLKHN